MTAEPCYYHSRGKYAWKKVPGLTGIFASMLGSIKAGEEILTARVIPDEGLYVPVEGIWFPAHILVAATHLPNRPHYSWFEITGYLTELVEHKNRDKFDNRVPNLEWVKDPGAWDCEILMQQPRTPETFAYRHDVEKGQHDHNLCR